MRSWPIIRAKVEPSVVTVAHDQNGVAIEVTRVNRYTVTERLETDAGVDWRVTYESTFELEGTGEQQGRTMALSGHGIGRGSFRFRPDPGVYLGGSEESEMRLVAFVEEGGQRQMIPIRQRRDETVERID